MNILKRELRANFKSLMIWSGTMIFLVFVGMVKYSGFQAVGQTVNEMFAQMPKAVTAIFGLEGLDLTKISAFYALFYLYFILLGGIHAAMLGATIISKEQRDKTADFLLVKPIVRRRIVTAKVLAALINVLILNLVTLVSSIYFVDMYNTGAPITDEIIRLMIALLIIQLIFLAIGFACSSLLHSTKKATGLSTFIILATFMLSIGIDLNKDLKILTALTPFKYFKTADIIYDSHFSLPYILLSLLIILTSLTTTYYLYNKQDIHS